MKTILLFALTLVITCSAIAQSKVTSSKILLKESNTNSILNENETVYLVGSDNFPEYKVEIKKCSTKGQIALSNGKTAPALNCFIMDKKEYIGGTLVYLKKKTVIVDIKMEPEGKDGARFTVIGKGFDMSFTLSDGMILRVDGEEVIFHTEGKGAWKIKKKV